MATPIFAVPIRIASGTRRLNLRAAKLLVGGDERRLDITHQQDLFVYSCYFMIY